MQIITNVLPTDTTAIENFSLLSDDSIDVVAGALGFDEQSIILIKAVSGQLDLNSTAANATGGDVILEAN